MKNKAIWFNFSLILNLLLIFGLWLIVQRLGGLKFAAHRIIHSEAGLYSHRKQLFELLESQKTGTIVFLGDSQTEQCEWRELFGDSLAIINRGIVADHADGVLKRLPSILEKKPSVIFLQIGINDLLHGMSNEQLGDALSKIVQLTKKTTPETKIVLQSIFPVNNDIKWVGADNKSIQAANLMIQSVAIAHDLAYLDVATHLTDENGNLDKKFTEDGIHLNGAGYLVWKKAIQDKNLLQGKKPASTLE